EVEPGGREGRARRARRRGDGPRPRARDRGRGSSARVRPLLPRPLRTRPTRIGARARDRPPGRRGPWRHGRRPARGRRRDGRDDAAQRIAAVAARPAPRASNTVLLARGVGSLRSRYESRTSATQALWCWWPLPCSVRTRVFEPSGLAMSGARSWRDFGAPWHRTTYV